MGGAAMCLGNTTLSAEFNIYVDPHAANIVLDSGIPLTMMGLDVTYQVTVNRLIINSMNENTQKSWRTMEFYTIFHKNYMKLRYSFMTHVIAYLLEPNILKVLVNVIVEENSKLTRGETIVDWLGVTKRKPNCMVMNHADDKIFEILKNKLSYLPKNKNL